MSHQVETLDGKGAAFHNGMMKWIEMGVAGIIIDT
jgi:hypothetical protein